MHTGGSGEIEIKEQTAWKNDSAVCFFVYDQKKRTAPVWEQPFSFIIGV